MKKNLALATAVILGSILLTSANSAAAGTTSSGSSNIPFASAGLEAASSDTCWCCPDPHCECCKGAIGIESVTPPRDVELLAPSPNPFQNETMFALRLPQRQRVSLRVYNVSGRLVRSLADGELPAGERRFTFAAKGMGPGLYIAVLRTNGKTRVRRALLIR